jgi:hypothetical protein
MGFVGGAPSDEYAILPAQKGCGDDEWLHGNLSYSLISCELQLIDARFVREFMERQLECQARTSGFYWPVPSACAK